MYHDADLCPLKDGGTLTPQPSCKTVRCLFSSLAVKSDGELAKLHVVTPDSKCFDSGDENPSNDIVRLDNLDLTPAMLLDCHRAQSTL